ncbi:hypothetical protein NKH47_08340 [Mesorhizobium sp. M1060]|uniref:hypothetical protein n=1 Tax=Mesorhizobium sp. M1060 TaxID=2957052 RepID=UPI003337E4B6
MVILGLVKPAQNKRDGGLLRETVPAVTQEELRRAMLEFVEALAVADARSDHLQAVGASAARNVSVDADHRKTKASDT